jgi:hypothetical protein
VVDLDGGETETVGFLNYCEETALMHTKGFWQNQGCSIIDNDDLVYLRTLAPFHFPDTPTPDAAKVDTGGIDNCEDSPVHCPDVTVLPFNTDASGISEVGCFIVARNSQTYYSRIGLAQQLLAFVLNMRHWGDVGGTVMSSCGASILVQDLIQAAVAAWETGTDANVYQTLLTCLNESGTVQIIPETPCPVTCD